MTGYVLSPAAQVDLAAIWDYTAQRWGQDQADRYILGMREVCEALAAGRRKGRAIEDVRPGYLKLSVGSHLLFYRANEPAVSRLFEFSISAWTWKRISEPEHGSDFRRPTFRPSAPAAAPAAPASASAA